MRHFIKIGDIYKVSLDNDVIRFFQYIGKDRSELSSDVIRIFKNHYSNNDRLDAKIIVNDDIECYMHSSVRVGLKFGLWEKFSYSSIIGTEEVYFRDSYDYGKYPCQQIVSHNWVVWKMNGERIQVGTLPAKYYHADIGGVYAPNHVIYRLMTGMIPDKYYPSY